MGERLGVWACSPDGASTGMLLALTHVGLAVVLLLAGVAVISRSFAQGGRAPAFDVASATLIVLIGMYLVYRAIWPSLHAHHRDGRTLAMATGLVPCPLTTFILTYALVHDKLAVETRRRDRHAWRGYALSCAKTSAQIAALDAEYERLRAQGPDFTGYDTGSEFREPPAHSITREDRIKILVCSSMAFTPDSKHCRSERGQAVSCNYRQVLGVLLSFAVKRSRVFPSLDTIARMAMVQQVQRCSMQSHGWNYTAS